MKQGFFTLICALMLPVFAAAQKIPVLKPLKELPESLSPLEKKGMWGFADAKGKFVIKPVFDEVCPFRDATADQVTIGVAKVRVGDKWGFITQENVYLFEPGYDALTDFDEGAVAVGVNGDTKTLLGVIPSMAAKGKFRTLVGIPRLSNLTDVRDFMASGLAWASVSGRWGLLTRKGFWQLPAEYDDWFVSEADGVFHVIKDGKVGAVSADGRVILAPEFDELGWEGSCFLAVNNGLFGEYTATGQERYPCIFPSVPEESAAGYVEMWKDGMPCLYIPGDRMYTVKEYDENLFKTRSYEDYVASPALPDWLKSQLKEASRVSIKTDLPEFKEVNMVEEADSCYFPTIVLKSGLTLGDILSGIYQEDLSQLQSEPVHYCDRGRYLYIWHHSFEEYHTFVKVDMQEWEWERRGACGAFTFREKEGILAEDGVPYGGLTDELYPACFSMEDRHVPVLRYAYYLWGGKPTVTLGHNIPPSEGSYTANPRGWNVTVSAPMVFELGDFYHSDDGDYRELSSVEIQSPHPHDGIAIYEVKKQPVWNAGEEDARYGDKETVACGFIGLGRPFFTQALFEDARWNESGSADVKRNGKWTTVLMEDLPSMDPFEQPALSKTEEAIPFNIVEEKPSFNGGDANEFSKWVNSQLVYPKSAKENGIQGRVTLQFTVEADGRVTTIRVVRGVDPSLDAEALRVVSMSPRWKPGKQRNKAVRVTYTFPVIFQLR